MSEILACIVTYNPDLELFINNVNSIVNEVDYVVIVDNNSSNVRELSSKCVFEKISFIENKDNIGIAAALNQGLELALSKNMKYILTMDQDSFFEKGGLQHLKNKMEEMDENVAMIGPLMRDMNSDFVEYFDEEINFVTTIITSGALCKTHKLQQVGGWEEKLFIDKVDFDICYKLLLKKQKIVKINNIFLNHNLGESVKKRFLVNFLITNHSALRVYYQFRNTIFLYKKYYKYFFRDMIKLFLSDVKKIVGIVLFEKNKYEKIKGAISGLFDGIFNNYGKKK